MAMGSTTTPLPHLLLLLSFTMLIPTMMGCIPGERESLLGFKAGLDDPSGLLSSWVGHDCCGWTGVSCSNRTGHVVALALRGSYNFFEDDFPVGCIGGDISPSLLGLQHLHRLDLSKNFFKGIQIPTFFGSFKELRSLNLYDAGFGGLVPHQLGNLSSLRHLDLSMNSFQGIQIPTFFGSFKELRYLDLSYAGFGGLVPHQLGNLSSLRHLDLSINSFQGIQIPTFFGSFKGLRYLNLSYAGFGGLVPHQLGNLSSLRYLDLSLSYHYSMYMESGRWLSNLSSLQNLNLADVDLSRAPDSWESLNGLPSLSVLDLSYTHFVPIAISHVNFTSLRVLHLSDFITIPPWLFQITGLQYLYLRNYLELDFVLASIGNLTSLQVLDLSNHYLGIRLIISGIPASLGNLCELRELIFQGNPFGGNFSDLGATVMSGCIKDSLETLSWSYSNLTGQLPDWLGDIKNLKHLDLSYNWVYGQLPDWLGDIKNLKHLDLSYNSLNGTLPENLGQLSELVDLDLSYNNLEGVLSESHFSNLTRLEKLDMSSNSLTLDVGSDWDPPPCLTYIDFGSCKLGPAFPLWLRKLGNLSFVNISNAGISDALPGWFWSFSFVIVDINLSHNDIKGVLPSSLRHLINLETVDLSSNRFEGPLPQFSSALYYLDLSNNSLSGPIYPNIGEVSPHISFLVAFANNINGSIPLSICQLNNLMILDLSGNQLVGEIPDCWDRNRKLYNMDPFQHLEAIDLGNNNLSGGIPTTICSLLFHSLHLNDNGLSGELNLTLRNCTKLGILDLAQNKFSGSIPAWIGESHSYLECLRLRSNMFVGNIPPQLGNLQYLHVIDLAHNHLSGTIPHTFGNFSAMKFSGDDFSEAFDFVEDGMEVYMKGREENYGTLLQYLRSMDLAGNNLTGEIPEELTTLTGLQNLNLSGNHLTGNIPENISELQLLESLDLSINNLSGAIPTSMTAMRSLDVLNMSFNNFFGKIPYGGQLQTLTDPSIYIGNHKLCGFPLNTKCQDDGTSQPQQMVKNDEKVDSETEGFYLSMGVGFAVGLWTVFGILLISKRWRIAYFRFFDDMYDKIYVALAISMARMNN